jgi:hypothetical protein
MLGIHAQQGVYHTTIPNHVTLAHRRRFSLVFCWLQPLCLHQLPLSSSPSTAPGLDRALLSFIATLNSPRV